MRLLSSSLVVLMSLLVPPPPPPPPPPPVAAVCSGTGQVNHIRQVVDDSGGRLRLITSATDLEQVLLDWHDDASRALDGGGDVAPAAHCGVLISIEGMHAVQGAPHETCCSFMLLTWCHRACGWQVLWKTWIAWSRLV